MLTRIEQKRVFSQIIAQIKEQIASGAWKAGDKLPSERLLCEQLGVSRPAVREALRALEILGLVRCVQGDANYLAEDLTNCMDEPLSMMFSMIGGDVSKVEELRCALELETARLAAVNCTPESARELTSFIQQMAQAQDEYTRAELDRKLHFFIAEMSCNPLILSVLNASSGLIDRMITGIRVSIMNDSVRIAVIDGQHRALVQAIAGKNAEEAARIMREHMQTVREYRQSILKE